MRQLKRHTPSLTTVVAPHATDPLYVDFTWGAGGTTSDLTLQLVVESHKRFGLETNMHLTW